MPHNTFYDSDFSAPVLANVAGDLIAVFNMALVTGGPNIAISSVTRVGALATYTTTVNHTLSPTSLFPIDRRLDISGFSQSEYNGTFLVSITGFNTFTATVAGTPTTPGTGTGIAKLTPLGWTNPWSATNKKVFQQGAGSSGFCLDIDDTIGANYVKVRGYESMSGVGAGSGQFPTISQAPQGNYNWVKSSSSTALKWTLVGNSKAFQFLGATPTDLSNYGFWHVFFGDILSEVQGDAYNCIIGAVSGVGSSPSYVGTAMGLTNSISATNPQLYAARSSTGVGGSIQIGLHSDGVKSSNSASLGNAALPYPALNGGMYLAPVICHHNLSPRGLLLGILNPMHARPIGHLDYFSGTGIYSGRRFQMIFAAGTSGQAGCVAIEVSPW